MSDFLNSIGNAINKIGEGLMNKSDIVKAAKSFAENDGSVFDVKGPLELGCELGQKAGEKIKNIFE